MNSTKMTSFTQKRRRLYIKKLVSAKKFDVWAEPGFLYCKCDGRYFEITPNGELKSWIISKNDSVIKLPKHNSKRIFDKLVCELANKSINNVHSKI